MNARAIGPATLRFLLVALALGAIAELPAASGQESTGRRAPVGGMSDNPGMAELMAALGPNAACPRGACGYGRDGIPDPYPGSGIVGGTRGARAAAEAAFPASNTLLLSWLSSLDIMGRPENANDIWGYTSPSGREYAIVGFKTGTAFVEITDPAAPSVVAVVPGGESDWRDMAVYRDHAYSVNEREDGIQVIDVSRIDRGRVRLRRTVTDDGLRTAHNIFVNEDSGYAYLLGSNLSRGGMVAVDLSDPANPVLEPVLWDLTYVHDVQVVSYTKGRYAGREIAFAFTGPQGLHIIDVTDKAAPRTLSHLPYANATYGHSGSLSPNRKLLYVNDELDERSNPAISEMTTYVVRVGDLEAPRLVKTVGWGVPAIDHNSIVQGNRLFLSAYRAGLRVIDLKQPGSPRMRGYLDTNPEDDDTRFTGAWGVYAGFASGTVVVSDIERGLFVVRAF